jgi:hypothetical protein
MAVARPEMNLLTLKPPVQGSQICQQADIRAQGSCAPWFLPAGAVHDGWKASPTGRLPMCLGALGRPSHCRNDPYPGLLEALA